MDSKNKKTDLGSNLLILVSVLALLGAIWTYIEPRFVAPDLPPLPDPPVQGLHKDVRSQIEQGYAKVYESPHHVGANGKLGMILHVSAQMEAAVVCYQRARILAPQSHEWAYYTGVALKKLGRDDAAREHLTAAVTLNSDYLASRLALAELELTAGRLTEALQHFELAAVLAPGSPYAHYGLGKTFSAMGEATQALLHYGEAITIAPRFGEAHYALAMAYRSEGDTRRAAEQLALYQRYEGVKPPRNDALFEALYQLDKGGQAIVRNGNAKLQQGLLGQAAEQYERALAVDPDLIEPHVRLIGLYNKAGKPELSEHHFQQAVEKKPDTVVAYVTFAQVLVAQKRYAEAIAVAEKAIELNPYRAGPHIILGQIDEQEGRPDAATVQFRRALEIEPKNRRAALGLGRRLLLGGDRQAAEPYLQKSLDPDDVDASSYYVLVAQAYEGAGDRSAAIAYLGSARERATAQKNWQLLAQIEKINRQWLERAQTP